MITVNGKFGIKATIVLDSISLAGKRITTFELEYPRMIHAELMTHRQFSRNAASSRAIPFNKMLEQLTARPVRFGANQSGMQDAGEHTELVNGLYTPEEWWRLAGLSAKTFSRGYAEAGYHKQIANRLTEPFQVIKVLVTATELDNFFWLRDDAAADPSLEHLAQTMFEAFEQSVPLVLQNDEWHLPYIERCSDGTYGYWGIDEEDGTDTLYMLSLEDAIIMSCALCAAVSYRNIGYDLAKCKEVYDRLVQTKKLHGSALEHCAKPMLPEHIDYATIHEEFGDDDTNVNVVDCPNTWEVGISHMDREGSLWSGNFAGWIQWRKTIIGECYVPK